MKKLILITILVLSTYIGNAQWQKLNSPGNGIITCFAYQKPKLFVGSFSGGMFFSTDYGDHWTEINNGLTNNSVLALATNGTNIFAGTVGGVFLSTDEGAHWTEVNNGLTYTQVESLVINRTNIFAGTPGGVFLSTNNGISWTLVNNGLDSTWVSSLATSNSNIYAGIYNGGLYFSSDNGSNWSYVNTVTTNTGIFSLAAEGSNIIVGTWGSIFISNNNGSNWNEVNNGLPGTEINSLAISGTIFLAGTDLGVSVSTNNGNNWNYINIGMENTFVRSLAIIGNYIYAGTLGEGLWKRSLSQVCCDNANVLLYPNPTNGRFNLILDNISSDSIYKVIDLEIYNLFGDKITSISNFNLLKSHFGFTSTKEIDLGNYPKGIYVVKIVDGVKTYTKKILVQ